MDRHDLAIKQRHDKQTNNENRCLKETLPQGSSVERHQTCESESAKKNATCDCSMIDKSINQETISRQTYHEDHRTHRSKPGAPTGTSVRFTYNASGMMSQ